MEDEIKVDVYPKKLIFSAMVIGDFIRGKEILEANDYRIISLEEDAMLIMEEDLLTNLMLSGNYTKEAILYIPTKGIYLTRDSPIMEVTSDKVAERNDSDLIYLTSNQIEKALLNSVKLDKKRSIPTDRFPSNEITDFAFGKYARRFGDFLRYRGIGGMTLNIESDINKETRPFARQVYFRSIPSGAGIGKAYFGDFPAVRGIREEKYYDKEPARKDEDKPKLNNVVKFNPGI